MYYNYIESNVLFLSILLMHIHGFEWEGRSWWYIQFSSRFKSLVPTSWTGWLLYMVNLIVYGYCLSTN